MKLRATFGFSVDLNIPDLLAEKAPGGVPTVVKEIADQLKAEMGLKYGKEVTVDIEVLP